METLLLLCLGCRAQLKQMEVQLEEEYEDKQKVLREKRELESKLSAASDQVPPGQETPAGGCSVELGLPGVNGQD